MIEERSSRPHPLHLAGWTLAVILSTALIGAAVGQAAPIDLTEALGFVTGAWCVYLVVREHVGNFPVGIANNIFFLVLFWRARLFGDAVLQLVYLGLGVHGWYQWLRGGERRTALKVRIASTRLLVIAAGVTIVGTLLLTEVLRQVRGSAPGLDGVTTMLSLTAQTLLNRKYLQNWYFWMLADVIYVWLYVERGLYLTAILYAVFFVMCIFGLRFWMRSHAVAVADSVPGMA